MKDVLGLLSLAEGCLEGYDSGLRAGHACGLVKEAIEKIQSEPLVFPQKEDSGMTLRDYFAANNVDTAYCQYVAVGKKTPSMQEVAETAYKMADAMLAEREKAE
jgi:hypothetical protein